jgi:hypothetical protein
MRPSPKLRWVLSLVWLAAACGEDTPEQRFPEQFDSFWQTFDQTYPYFEHKQIDWQAAYERFRPRVEQLSTQPELIELLREMLAPLRDVHLFFVGPDGRQLGTYRPSAEVNWDREVWNGLLARHGWRQIEPSWGVMQLGAVPYVAVTSWSIQGLHISRFDEVFEEFRHSPALIFDVRMNGGGNDGLAFDVAGRFARQETVSSYVKFRNGPGHSDFTEPAARLVSPRGPWQFERPVVVLAGRGCFSSTESFIAAMRVLPQVVVMGDTTGGSSGNPGFFDLAPGWRYTVSRWFLYTADGIVVEWNGIPPDVHVPASAADFQAGRDPVFEFALQSLGRQLAAVAP